MQVLQAGLHVKHNLSVELPYFLYNPSGLQLVTQADTLFKNVPVLQVKQKASED